MFNWNSKTKFELVRDGLSHTIMVGERAGREHTATWVGSVHGSHDPSWRVIGWAGFRPNAMAGEDEARALFSSEHGRVTNYVFADGSVHTIRDTIGIETFRALATIDADDYSKKGDLSSLR